VLKVMTIVGTRPEIIRLSRIIPKLDKYCAHTLVHTGQNYDYELNEIFFSQLAVRSPDFFLSAAGETVAETIAQVISASDKVFASVDPDAVLILGDTNSSLAAIPAKRRKIPIFHMEAGNRCFDLRVPEEINRRIVDHISDINLTYSQIARDYLLREGMPPDQVICTGSPMAEVLDFYRDGIEASQAVVSLGLKPNGYFLVSVHREENVDSDSKLQSLFRILADLVAHHDLDVVVSTHPRTRKRIETLGLQTPERVTFSKPFGFLDYVKLQMEARAVLSDSGTITEESSILNFPAINLRDVNERPEGVEEGSVIMTGLDPDRVEMALRVLADQPRGKERLLQQVNDYKPLNVSEKVVRTLISYTEFVNQRVWKKR